MGSRTHFKNAVEGCREIGHWEEGIGIISRMELLQQFSVLTGGVCRESDTGGSGQSS